jgi:hypothetical protein
MLIFLSLPTEACAGLKRGGHADSDWSSFNNTNRKEPACRPNVVAKSLPVVAVADECVLFRVLPPGSRALPPPLPLRVLPTLQFAPALFVLTIALIPTPRPKDVPTPFPQTRLRRPATRSARTGGRLTGDGRLEGSQGRWCSRRIRPGGSIRLSCPGTS